MTDWRNRIIAYGTKPADQFCANPFNPRRHPQSQREAVKGSLDTLGWIGVVVENVRTGYLIDGHERVMQALESNAEVPFVQVDLSEEEEKLALASFDWITQMAVYDAETLDALLREVNTDDAALQSLLGEMAMSQGIIPPNFDAVDGDGQPRLDEKKRITCPSCGHEFTSDDIR